jgi:integrase
MAQNLQVVPRTTTTPLEDLVSDYLASCRARGLSEATLAGNYGFALLRILLPWCTSNNVARVEELNERTLNRFATHLLLNGGKRGQPLSKYSVRTYIRPVRFMLTWAERHGEEVPAKPEIPRVGKRFRDVLTREEIERVEKAADTERDKLIIRIFADCGLRLNELTRLRTIDLKRNENLIALHVRGKGDRERRVPVPPGLARRIQRFVSGNCPDGSSRPLFRAKRRGLSGQLEQLEGSGVAQMVRWTGRRAGLGKPVHPHLFRHSWMTEMLRRGMNPIQLSVIAGASQQVIADHYEHLNLDDANNAMLRAWSKDERG